MKFKHILVPLVIIFGLTACDSDDEGGSIDGAVDLPAGSYATECEDTSEGTPSSEIARLVISSNGSVEKSDDVYETADCSGEFVTESDGEGITIQLSDEELAPNISYITVTSEGQTFYVPYHYEDGVFSAGFGSETIDPDAATVFSDFIENYQQNTEDIFIKQ